MNFTAIQTAVQNNPDCKLYHKGSPKVKSLLNPRHAAYLIRSHAENAANYLTDEETTFEEGEIESEYFCPLNKSQYFVDVVSRYFGG